MKNIIELRDEINAAIDHAREIGINPREVCVSVQIDDLRSTDINFCLTNEGNASGCSLIGLWPDPEPWDKYGETVWKRK